MTMNVLFPTLLAVGIVSAGLLFQHSSILPSPSSSVVKLPPCTVVSPIDDVTKPPTVYETACKDDDILGNMICEHVRRADNDLTRQSRCNKPLTSKNHVDNGTKQESHNATVDGTKLVQHVCLKSCGLCGNVDTEMPSNSQSARRPPQAFLSQSYLTYLHIPKTGGTSFNRMLLKEPLLFASRGENMSRLPEKIEINCGFLPPYGPTLFVNVTDKLLQNCYHFTYEGSWSVFEDILERKDNALLLTHIRSPYWHVLSMLGHDVKKGTRYKTYSEKLSGQYTGGYNLNNHVHRVFQTQNTSSIVDKLEHAFFWYGLSEYMEASWCLLLWQLHVFDYEFCSKLCNTDEVTESDHTGSGQNEVYSKVNVVTEAGAAGILNPEDQILTQAQMKEIARITSKDQTIYEVALVLFNERVDFVESDVGFRFLHCNLSQ